MRRTLAAAAAALAILPACIDNEMPPGETAAGSKFIALQSDFKGFTNWEMYLAGDDTQAGGGHPEGPRKVYINQLPASGSSRFPVGTMIVKVRGDGDPQTWEVHGMVKRGGDFNVGGATGWEFFDLRMDDTGTPVILWRGMKAPAGHGYISLTGPGGEDDTGVTEDCNSCHVPTANDSVLTPDLNLQGL